MSSEDTSHPSTDRPDSHPDDAQRIDEELALPPRQPEASLVDPGELRASAQERAKQRPILQKILSVFQKAKTSYRELIINSEPLEKRVALLVDGRLEKFEIERQSDDRMVGGIYKGRIKNLDNGLKASFVDIGYNKNAFLHYW
ncbi:MAG: ribonuclease E/G, partial [Opitutaceae bacterium]